MFNDLRESLAFDRQHDYLDQIEAYVDQIEMDNLQMSVTWNNSQVTIMLLQQRLQLIESQYNNMKLISNINKQFVRRGLDPWRKVNKLT